MEKKRTGNDRMKRKIHPGRIPAIPKHIFRKRQQHIIRVARMLMDRHSCGNWCFAFNKEKRSVGTCDIKNKTISLSKHHSKYLTDEMIVDVLLHEISHALHPEDIDHGFAWKRSYKHLRDVYNITIRGSEKYRLYKRVETLTWTAMITQRR